MIDNCYHIFGSPHITSPRNIQCFPAVFTGMGTASYDRKSFLQVHVRDGSTPPLIWQKIVFMSSYSPHITAPPDILYFPDSFHRNYFKFRNWTLIGYYILWQEIIFTGPWLRLNPVWWYHPIFEIWLFSDIVLGNYFKVVVAVDLHFCMPPYNCT